MPTLLITYWKPIAIALLCAVLYGGGYYHGYKHEKSAYDAFVQAAKVSAQVQQANSERINSEQKDITNNVAKGYSDAVSKINDYYKSHPHIVRVSDSAGGCNLPSTGEGTKGTAATTEGAAEVAPTIELDVKSASLEITQCQKLIEWETSQEGVK